MFTIGKRYIAYIYSVGGVENAVKNYMLGRKRVWKDPTVGEYEGYFRAMQQSDVDVTKKVLGMSRTLTRPTYLLEQIDTLVGDSSLKVIKKGRIVDEIHQLRPFTDGQIYATLKMLERRVKTTA